MPSNATIGALRVVLGADTAAFEDGLKKAEKSLSVFGINLAKWGAGLSVTGTLIGIGVAIKGAIDQADELGKSAQKIGVPIEELSKLKYAADLSGVSMEQLENNLGKLAKNMSLAAGGSDEAQKGFRALGVSVTGADGALRPTADVVADIAGKFEKLSDATGGKAALAMEVFGKSGRDMIPLLNSGAKGLREMYTEAEQLGLVISEKTYKAAEAFNDNLTRLDRVKQGMVLTITAQLLPALQTMSGMLVEAAKNSGALSQAGEQAQNALATMTVTALYTITGMKGLADVLNQVNGIAQELGAGNFSNVAAGISNLGTIVNDIIDKFSKVPETAKALLDGWKATGEGALSLAGKIDAPVIAAKNFQKALDDLRIKTIELQQGFVALAPGFVQQAISLGIMDASAAKAGLTVADLTAKQQQLNTAMWGVEGQQLRQQALSQFDQFAIKLQAFDAALSANAINVGTHAKLVKKSAEEIGNTWEQAGASIAGSIQGAASAFGAEYSKMAAAAKIAGAAQALINAYIGASNALASGIFPANLAAAASVLAAGIGFAATLNSVAVPALAQGGSFTVPGGMSGVDTRMMTLALAAGERVDVTPARDAGSSSAPVDVIMRGVSPKVLFAGENVKEFFDGLNDKIRDGYRIKVMS